MPWALPLLLVLGRALAVAPFDLLPPRQALAHGLAMVAAATPEVSELEIARIARHESGFWVDARPGLRHWPHQVRRFPRRHGYVCGLMQATAQTPRECLAWIADPQLAYRAGVAQLREWHHLCRRIGRRGSGRYRCARAGYARGTLAARNA